MHFLEFILLLLIPSNINADDCQPKISLTRGQSPCSGLNFTIVCQFKCSGYVKLMKGNRLERSANGSFELLLHIDSANQSHSGKYSCVSPRSSSMVYLTVVDNCGVTLKHVSAANTSFPLTNTTHQSSTMSSILEPVLIWYILFKTGFFLIGSITGVLITVCQKN